MRLYAVIGKNFGDEGKGLASAGLCCNGEKCLIIKHNGGGQAGHTVENADGSRRFIHHQIGSGAEYGADTLFASTFHPDLYQILKEVSEFRELFYFTPQIFGEKTAEITTIDDVMLNMGAEEVRGKSRHGSCGMGINECAERVKSGFSLTLQDIAVHDEKWVTDRLFYIRNKYTFKRAAFLGISTGEYYEMLHDDDLLLGYAESIKNGIGLVKIVDASAGWLTSYDRVVFETGQGLLLDNDYGKYMPYLTPSKTGLYNPVRFLKARGLKLDEAIYVTRPYVTRHGEGPLPCECSREELPGISEDLTNVPNPWQGTIRYGRHENITAFCEEMMRDVCENIGLIGKQSTGNGYDSPVTLGQDTRISILFTHMDETGGRLYFENHTYSLTELVSQLPDFISKIYVSDSRSGFREYDRT